MGASRHPYCGEEVSFPSAGLGAVAGGSNSAHSSCRCFGDRLRDVVGFRDNWLILILAKILGVLFYFFYIKLLLIHFPYLFLFIFAERNKIVSGCYCAPPPAPPPTP